MKSKSETEKKVEAFLVTAPAKFEKREKMAKPAAAKVEKDRYGFSLNSSRRAFYDVIGVLVDAKRPDAITPENLAAITGKSKGLAAGAISWFNHRMVWSPEVSDFTRKVTVEYPAAAPALPFIDRRKRLSA